VAGYGRSELTVIVIVSGMPRSGSTWSYNVCRQILDQAGMPLDPATGLYGDGDEVDEIVARGPMPGAALLVKCHIPGRRTVAAMKAGRVRNIYTYRDPRDAVASLRRTFGTSFRNSVRVIHRWLRFVDDVAALEVSLGIDYRQIETAPERAVAAVAETLGVELRPDRAAAIAAALGRDEMRKRATAGSGETARLASIEHDTVTGLTRNHIPHDEQSDWRRNLSVSEGRFATWLWRRELRALGRPVDPRDYGGLWSMVPRTVRYVRLRPWTLDPYAGGASLGGRRNPATSCPKAA
jgi:hypothetical protein